jgi:predicted nucleotidyltransferase
MVDRRVRRAIRKYLQAVRKSGIDVKKAVLFGSQARGTATEWSDIDLVVIAPELEAPAPRRLRERLWILSGHTDSRIEPIPCGVNEWETDDGTPILEYARREGIEFRP